MSGLAGDPGQDPGHGAGQDAGRGLARDVASVMRGVARDLLQDPSTAMATVDEATLAMAPDLAADPVLAASVRAATRANLLHWLGCVLADPAAPVPPNVTPEALALARDLVRRGLDATSLNAYRAGQNEAWNRWMERVFERTSDPQLLRAVLEASARSIFGFVDTTLAGVGALIEAERDALTTGASAQRREAVTLVLEGAPISSDLASARLGHDLRRQQTAAVLWQEGPAGTGGDLERAAEALGRALGVPRPLTVVATATSLWAWFATADAPDPACVQRAMAASPQVRAALGATAPGIAGFRQSHLDALAVQRLLLRAPGDVRVATYDEVQLVVLVTADEERAAEFTSRVLGPLATADLVLRETLRTYLREDSSASRAARTLFAHRNTVLNRLARAEALLPAPLAGRGLPVALALEVLHWLGPRGQP